MSTPDEFFTYTPVRGAPEAFAVVFAIIACFLAFKIYRTGSALWIYILVYTAFAECIGYALRAVCIEHASLGLFITMTLFLLLPPNALALFNYKVLGDISRQSIAIPHRFWLRPRFITWFFFASDIFAFMLQSTGGGMMASEGSSKSGKWICIIGLAIQLVFLALYLCVVFVVKKNPQYRVILGPRDTSREEAKSKLMRTITVTTVLLYVRSVYRLIEFVDGYGGKIYKAEWAFYVFDTAMILLAYCFYLVPFVGNYFPRNTNKDDSETYMMHDSGRSGHEGVC